MFINGVIKRRTRSCNLSKPFKTRMSSQLEVCESHIRLSDVVPGIFLKS